MLRGLADMTGRFGCPACGDPVWPRGRGTPFSDWRVPGVLLAGLVGGGFLLAGWWQWRGHRYARELSMAAGAGLVCFEAAELGWIGFQPLEAVFAAVGVSIIVLAWRLPRQDTAVTARGERQGPMGARGDAAAVPQPIGVGPEMAALSRFYRDVTWKGTIHEGGWARARPR